MLSCFQSINYRLSGSDRGMRTVVGKVHFTLPSLHCSYSGSQYLNAELHDRATLTMLQYAVASWFCPGQANYLVNRCFVLIFKCIYLFDGIEYWNV